MSDECPSFKEIMRKSQENIENLDYEDLSEFEKLLVEEDLDKQ